MTRQMYDSFDVVVVFFLQQKRKVSPYTNIANSIVARPNRRECGKERRNCCLAYDGRTGVAEFYSHLRMIDNSMCQNGYKITLS